MSDYSEMDIRRLEVLAGYPNGCADTKKALRDRQISENADRSCCELCGRWRHGEEMHQDEDGVCWCRDEAACFLASVRNGATEAPVPVCFGRNTPWGQCFECLHWYTCSTIGRWSCWRCGRLFYGPYLGDGQEVVPRLCENCARGE